MPTFQTIQNWRGYVSKPDKTNTSARNLVSGSQNVLINDEERIETRKGYELDGDSSTAVNFIESAFDWETVHDLTRHLRSYDDELEVRFVDADGDINWVKVADGWSAVDFHFTTWWDDTEKKDVLLFVNGDSNMYEWGGGVAEIDSTTSNTLTKKGTKTWAQSGFYTAGNKTVNINGTEYTYTGGETSTTLTGVSPDPTGEADGSFVTQKIITNTDKPAANLQNDFLITHENHVFIGSEASRIVYMSTNTDYTAITEASPRIPGNGATITLDNRGKAFAIQDRQVYLSAGKDDWYRTEFQTLDVGGTLSEVLKVKKLHTAPGQAAQSRDLVTKTKVGSVFIGEDNVLYELGQLENIQTPRTRPLSDPVKPDFDDADFTGGGVRAFKNKVYISAPNDGNVWILDIDKGFWQPPQILPVQKFAEIDSVLYGHSNAQPETYKLFTTTADNGNPIKSVAKLAYRHFNDRFNLKSFDVWAVEGYITSNTELTHRLNIEFGGAFKTFEKIISGADTDIIFEPTTDFSLGTSPLGDVSLAGDTDAGTDAPKFRVLNTFNRTDFFEVQEVFETNDIDQVWQILATGPSVAMSQNQPTFITK